jgi:hypothetical protein
VVSQVSLVPAGPPAPRGCEAGPVSFTCSFTLQVDYSNAAPGSTVGGKVTGTASEPGIPSETRSTNFEISVDPSAGSVTATVRLFFAQNPCVEASSAHAASDRPNAVSSQVVAFGNICAPPFTVSKVTLIADDPSQTGCRQGAAGFVCSFTVVVEYASAQPGSQITGSITGTDAPPQVPPLVSVDRFTILADPSAGIASASVGLVFTTDPCVEDSTATAATDQPNVASSTSARFGRVCTPG